jgi:hypothetical protein
VSGIETYYTIEFFDEKKLLFINCVLGEPFLNLEFLDVADYNPILLLESIVSKTDPFFPE